MSQFAWSYSRYSCYKTCPYQYKCRYIDKLPEPPNPAMKRGIEIHKDAENYLLKKLRAVPRTLAKLGGEYKKLRENSETLAVEEQWGLNENWEETGYWDADIWLRVKVDAADKPKKNTVRLIDTKSGKIPRSDDAYREQLELYAVSTFSIFDTIEVATELWYTDQGTILGRDDPDFTFHIDEYDELRETWNMRVNKMRNDTKFKPTPNWLCTYCSFSKSKGGPCKY